MSIFGPLFSPHLLQQAVIDTLSDWFQTYLNEVQLQSGGAADAAAGNFYPVPRSFTTRNQFDKFPEDQLPLCVVVSPGLADEPEKEGDGSYRAWFTIGVGVVVSGSTPAATEELSKIYATAVRGILLQKQELGGISSGVEWADESYDELVDPDQDRSLRASLTLFRVLVEGVVVAGSGPAAPEPPDPDEQPGSDWPEVQTVHTEVNILDHDEDF